MRDEPTTWEEVNNVCKCATGCYARDIANPLIAEELDPNGDADYDPAAAILADLIGSIGDMNTRAASAAIIRELRQRGVAVEPRNDRKVQI